jgi:hypothetical protein
MEKLNLSQNQNSSFDWENKYKKIDVSKPSEPVFDDVDLARPSILASQKSLCNELYNENKSPFYNEDYTSIPPYQKGEKLKENTYHSSSSSVSSSSNSKESHYKSIYLSNSNKYLCTELKDNSDNIDVIKKSDSSEKIYENPYKSYKQELEEEKNSCDKILDSEFLKTMDKKLKKLVKTNLTDSTTGFTDEKNGQNPISWEISPNKATIRSNVKLLEQNQPAKYEFNIDDSICSSFITQQHLSHPYLPLREVPMHDLVKKLQKEFELDGETGNLPVEYKSLWEK